MNLAWDPGSLLSKSARVITFSVEPVEPFPEALPPDACEPFNNDAYFASLLNSLLSWSGVDTVKSPLLSVILSPSSVNFDLRAINSDKIDQFI